MATSLRTWTEYAVLGALLCIILSGTSWQSLFGSPSNQRSEVHGMLSQDQSLFLVYPSPDLECPKHALSVHVFSRSPLVIYIPNFVTEDESRHLIELS